MKSIQNKISWLVLGAMTTLMALAFICPMSMSTRSIMVAHSATSLCQSTIGMISPATGGGMGCMSAHLAVVGQFFSAIPYVMDFLAALVLLAVICGVLARHFLAAAAYWLYSRWRRLCQHYRTSIKLLVEQKLLRYLCFIGNYTVVSLS